jgi:hypothetical protein
MESLGGGEAQGVAYPKKPLQPQALFRAMPKNLFLEPVLRLWNLQRCSWLQRFSRLKKTLLISKRTRLLVTL